MIRVTVRDYIKAYPTELKAEQLQPQPLKTCKGKCKWQGKFSIFENGRCPNCGSTK